jgi:endoglucanase
VDDGGTGDDPEPPPCGLGTAVTIDSDWESGYCATVTLTDTESAATSSWTVVLDARQSLIDNLWNGSYYKSGSQYTVTSTHNGAIAPGGSQSFGFCADKSGSDYQPVIAGVSCQ